MRPRSPTRCVSALTPSRRWRATTGFRQLYLRDDEKTALIAMAGSVGKVPVAPGDRARVRHRCTQAVLAQLAPDAPALAHLGALAHGWRWHPKLSQRRRCRLAIPHRQGTRQDVAGLAQGTYPGNLCGPAGPGDRYLRQLWHVFDEGRPETGLRAAVDDAFLERARPQQSRPPARCSYRSGRHDVRQGCLCAHAAARPRAHGSSTACSTAASQASDYPTPGNTVFGLCSGAPAG